MKGVPVETVLRKLKKLYKPPKSFLNWSTPLELLMATVLSAQCTDARVNIVTKDLFKKYKRSEYFLKVPIEELEDDIHSCGHYHSKAKFLRGIAKAFIENDRKIPDTMEGLTALPGVGRKTASIILYVIFGKHEGIAVDTHVLRLSQRLGITKHSDPKKIELDLMAVTPKKDWHAINPLMISHGRAVCTALNRKCDQCVFQAECPSSWTRNLPDLAKKKTKKH